MKRSRFLLIFVLVAAAAATFLAVPSYVQANPSAPNVVTSTISFQYFMNDGSSGTGAYILSDDATFVDNDGDTGIWSFNQANNRYTLHYNAGAHCGALSIGTYNLANSHILGIRLCTDGSGGRGVWFGLLHGMTTRVSVASDGAQAYGFSFTPDVSADGRYVAFQSEANNLVNGDTNGHYDVFVHDRQTGDTVRVSVASNGAEANGDSQVPTISGNGQYVAFRSGASNLVSGDTNNAVDIFVHDRLTGVTSRVSVASDGAQANSWSYLAAISATGRYVAFQSAASNLVSGDTNGEYDVFVHDRQTGQTSRVAVASDGTQANGYSGDPDISADGRYVAFYASASNLVGDDTNGAWDIFVHDRQTGQTSRVSVASDGAEADNGSAYPAISADGQYITFLSYAGNLVSGDTNGWEDIFVHHRQTGQTSRVSVASDGAQSDNYSLSPAISSDGRYVAFACYAGNLVSGDTNGAWDIFVHDRQTGQTSRVSIAANGAQGNGPSQDPAISADGRLVAFLSDASNLVSGDTNSFSDIFVHDRGAAVLIR